jgi:hypothetical protein
MTAGVGREGSPALPLDIAQPYRKCLPIHSQVWQPAAYTLDLAGAGVIGACSRASPGNWDLACPRDTCRRPAAGRSGIGCGCLGAPWQAGLRCPGRRAGCIRPGRGTSDNAAQCDRDTHAPHLAQRLAARPRYCRRIRPTRLARRVGSSDPASRAPGCRSGWYRPRCERRG